MLGYLSHANRVIKQISPFVTTWTTFDPNTTIELPLDAVFDGPYDFIVDWGDNTQSHITWYEDRAHVYSNPGTYTVTINGTLKSWSFSKYGVSKDYIVSVESFGNVGIEELDFGNCYNLYSITGSIPETVTDMTQCFGYCTSLSNISTNLFERCSQVSSLQSCFSGCTSITSIPNGFFDNCVNVTNFQAIFYGCSLIVAIPSGLFDNCVNVTDFSYCFGELPFMESIPINLFDNCTEVTTFEECFKNCTSITSAVPTLWTRTNPTPIGTNCFTNCTNAANYADIPAGWK